MEVMVSKADRKASAKAARIAAYEARCEAHRKADALRQQGIVGSDRQVLRKAAAVEAAAKAAQVKAAEEQAKAELVAEAVKIWGPQFLRFLAGRDKTRSLAQLKAIMDRFEPGRRAA